MITAKTVYGAFAESAARWPDRPFLNVLPETAEIYGIDAGEITYAEALKTVQDHVAEIEAAGYIKGQRVMVLLENRPSYFLWWLAFNALGISVVPVNPDLRAAEMEYMIGHGEPVLALSLASRAEELRSAAEAAKVQMPVVTLGEPLPKAVTTEAIAARNGDAEAALLYTSGTTGQPKGCILTDEYFIEAGRWYSTATGVCALNTDGERMITPLPIFHMNAMAFSFMAMVAVGGCLTALDRFHPRSWWDSVRRSRATCLHYLGVMPSMLMGAEPCAEDRNHSVRFGFGAGIDPKLHAPFEERFGFALTEAWAMTETGAGATICANREPRNVGTSCIGWPQDTVEARLVDDSGADADQGELLVRHAGSDPRKGFFAGYFKNPDATDEAWEGGWFHTGDLGVMHPDGYIELKDRSKDIIISGGENISTIEVEGVLYQHPAVAEAAVVAKPDEKWGETPCAFVALKEEAESSEEELIQFCRDNLAHFKCPKKIVFTELPKTATGKIQKFILREQAKTL